jgi:hypothetical protein
MIHITDTSLLPSSLTAPIIDTDLFHCKFMSFIEVSLTCIYLYSWHCCDYTPFGKQEVGIWWVQKRFQRYRYLYEACDQISDFCHQQLLRKMRRKLSWTDGRTEVKHWWQKSDIWSQASYMYPYHGKRFWTRQIPTSCLST